MHSRLRAFGTIGFAIMALLASLPFAMGAAQDSATPAATPDAPVVVVRDVLSGPSGKSEGMVA